MTTLVKRDAKTTAGPRFKSSPAHIAPVVQRPRMEAFQASDASSNLAGSARKL